MLLAGGAPGRRQILAHGRVVIHAPAAEGRGTIPDLVLEADEVERVRTMLEQILAEHTGRTPEQIREDTERDLILTPQGALEYGVVDAVLTRRTGRAGSSRAANRPAGARADRCEPSARVGSDPGSRPRARPTPRTASPTTGPCGPARSRKGTAARCPPARRRPRSARRAADARRATGRRALRATTAPDRRRCEAAAG